MMNNTKLYHTNADDHALPFTSNMKYAAIMMLFEIPAALHVVGRNSGLPYKGNLSIHCLFRVHHIPKLRQLLS